MPTLRHIMALLMMLAVVTTVCGACVPGPVVDACCEEPCQQCACFDATVPFEAPAAVAPAPVDLRPTLNAFASPFRETLSADARPAIRFADFHRVGSDQAPSLAMLSVFRI